MAATSRIPDLDWQKHRDELEQLYSIENKTLIEVMQVMESRGFHATKSQYVRKLKHLGIEKYSTNEKWKYIAQKVNKRKREGKDSDVYVNGKLVLAKKIKKEITRYTQPTLEQGSISAQSPPCMSGIDIRTPGMETVGFVDYFNIPWFEFEMLVEPCFERFGALAARNDAALQPASNLTTAFSPSGYDFDSVFQLGISHSVTSPGTPITQVGDGIDLVYTEPIVRDFEAQLDESVESHLPLSEVASNKDLRSLSSQIIGKDIDPDSPDYLFMASSCLNEVLIERHDEAALQILRYSIYLSSNNLLSNHLTDKLLQWIIKSNQHHVVKQIIRVEKPTTRIFGSNLLVAAARLKDLNTIRTLISLGIDVNIPGGTFGKSTALYCAVEERNIELIHILLKAGANPNAGIIYGPSNQTTPLKRAIDQGGFSSMCKDDVITTSIDIVRLLLKAGADVNIESGREILSTAAGYGNIELVRTLLAAKIKVNLMTGTTMTALQAAADKDRLDIFQILLDAGADVDAPAGELYQEAREQAMKGHDWECLISPIQYASAANNTEMVQIILDAGAEVDGYILNSDEMEAREAAVLQWQDRDYYTRPNYDYNLPSEDYLWRDEYERLLTPLQLAVLNRNVILTRLFIASEATVEGGEFGSTPLQIAAGDGHVQLVKLLLRKGADVNAPAHEKRGRTALQAAVEKRHHGIVEILLQAGAEVNAPAATTGGYTALQAAIISDNVEMMERLIFLGGLINARPSGIGGVTCLQAAAYVGDLDVIALLLGLGAEVNAPAADQYGLTALQAAASSGDPEAVNMLLTAGAHIDHVSDGVTALAMAAWRNDFEVVQLLLRKGANPSGREEQYRSPIMEAVRAGSARVVNLLIAAGADINQFHLSNVDTPTALHVSIDKENVDITKALLAVGADPNISYPQGHWGKQAKSLLQMAATKGNLELVRELLSSGADVNSLLRTTSGTTSLLAEALSTYSAKEEIIQLLVAAGADVNEVGTSGNVPLTAAVRRGMLGTVNLLLNAGANINLRKPDEDTALQAAMRRGNADIIKLLLSVGADMNAPAYGRQGRTALQAASESGKVSLVILLLQRGADCNAVAADDHGATALQAAAIAGHLRIVLLLLKAGADIYAPGAKSGGRTALEGAVEHGRLDIVSLLLRNDSNTEGLELRCKRAAKLALAEGHVHIHKLLRDYKRA
ncbi:ankyrin repeat-containing domain protein [Xylogone sp. PMI_703]|nr:ankyrin repeat-containing domain protein [Xylogone sp. PMI_703]